MNVLFANYGDFATNSSIHIAGFANALVDAGHACVVAVPWGADTVRLIHEARFSAATHRDCLQNPCVFPDGKPADLVHAWTPREGVRTFALQYCSRTAARLIVHLEDNEDYLFAAASGLKISTLLQLEEPVIRRHLTETLAHPRRARLLLHAADGITTILPTLRAFAPPSVPVHDLAPGIDFELFHPLERLGHQRSALGLRPGDRCIVYTGSTSSANADEMRDLYEAVALLNARGVPTLLLRTGADHPSFTASLPTALQTHVRHLGFIPRTELPRLVAQADVLVQPGRPGDFNNFRLPSKVPEFLAMGRPVILPASNLGLELARDTEAIVLDDATPERIADACIRLFDDRALAVRIGSNGAAFARRRFDGSTESRKLATFYEACLARKREPWLASSLLTGESDISLALKHAAQLVTISNAQAASDILKLLLPLVRHIEQPEAHRGDLVRIQRERDAWRIHFEDARNHAANLEQLNAELIQDIDSHKLAHAIHVDHLQQALAQREEKIARMTESFSWRVTMPLRALRRMFAGRAKEQPPVSAQVDPRVQST